MFELLTCVCFVYKEKYWIPRLVLHDFFSMENIKLTGEVIFELHEKDGD